jgi:hypothetical protein
MMQKSPNWLTKTIHQTCRWTHHSYRTIMQYIPDHIQMLSWYDESSVKNIYTILKPSFTWNSIWNQRNDINLFPKHGMYIWIIWNSSMRQREYICLSYKHMIELFGNNHNELIIAHYHDKAIIEKIRQYVHKEYQIHSKKHMFLEVSWKDIPLLKKLHSFKESLYVQNNLKGKDLFKLYQFLYGECLENDTHPHFTITNDDLEETILLKDDFLIIE